MFDYRKYAQVQEYGLENGGDYGPGPKGFCAMQAWNYCRGRALSEGYDSKGTPIEIMPIDGFEASRRVVAHNDQMGEEGRKFLLSILPVLEHYDTIMWARSEFPDREVEGDGSGVEADQVLQLAGV